MTKDGRFVILSGVYSALTAYWCVTSATASVYSGGAVVVQLRVVPYTVALLLKFTVSRSFFCFCPYVGCPADNAMFVFSRFEHLILCARVPLCSMFHVFFTVDQNMERRAAAGPRRTRGKDCQ